MDTLAVRLMVPLVGSIGDFHSQVSAPCRAHKKEGHGNEARAPFYVPLSLRLLLGTDDWTIANHEIAWRRRACVRLTGPSTGVVTEIGATAGA